MIWRTVLSFLWRRDFLIPQDGIRKLIDDHIPYRNLQHATAGAYRHHRYRHR